MKLYYFPGACSLATHIVLEWLDTPYETVKLDLASTKSPEYLERLDARLQGRDWLANERSIADPYQFVLLRWSIRLKVDLSGLENLARFFSRMSADAGVRAAIIAEEGSIDGEARLRS